jgi:hypothetical protein
MDRESVPQTYPGHEKRQANFADSSKVNQDRMLSTIFFNHPVQPDHCNDHTARRRKAQCNVSM